MPAVSARASSPSIRRPTLRDSRTWASARERAGKSLSQIIDGLDDGSIGFLYVVGEDLALALADEARTRTSLSAAPFLVVQDSYLTETAAYAHVVLPAAVPTEVEGTYTNGESIVQRVRARHTAPGPEPS